MRPGSSAVQQTLTTEAASVLKQSLTLARRRGHSQVTPLHVAATLLTSRASLLRRACIKSQLIMPHNHPLQCRALELCFNVALNRLPATSPGLGPGPGQPLFHHNHPSLSNALIAALKRAQAHQKRGSVEQQNQTHEQSHLLNVRVELEQLIISILDDPSVSRVMREAGFSSSAVKNHLEEDFFSSSSSFTGSSPVGFQCRNGGYGGVFSSPSSPSPPKTISPPNFWNTHFSNFNSEQNPVFNFLNSPSQKGDLRVVFEILMRNQRKNTVLVSDSVSVTEGLVSEVMGRLENEEVPDELKSTHFIRFQFASNLRFMRREDVDMDLAHLRRKVDGFISSLGSSEAIVVIYVGDLKWIIDCESSTTTRTGFYSPVDHLISETGKLIDDYSNDKSKVWLMGAASYETYMKCQMMQPSLEIQWSLQAVSVQSGGLGLTLHASREHVLMVDTDECKLNCCAECNSNYEKEVAFFISAQQKRIPSWLQSHGPKGGQKEIVDLRRKWNQSCLSLHQGQTHLAYASSQTWLPKQNTISFVDSNNFPHLRRQHSCNFEPRLDCLKNTEGNELRITLALGNSSISSPRKILEQRIGDNVINKRDMYKILEENVPGKSETISSITETLVDSISTKKDTWFLIEGNDFAGKRRLASAIAEAVSGSTDFLFQLNMRKSDTGATSNIEIFTDFLRNRDKLVALIENVDLADTQFMKLLTCRYETGTHDQQAIFILTTGDDATSNQENLMNQNLVIQMKLHVSYTNTNSITINSDHKRKPELDLSNSSKNPRIDDKKDGSSVTMESGDNKSDRKDLSRQSSVNTLDLNIKVDEDDELCNLTHDSRENDLLGLIKNRFVFSCAPIQMRDTILSKIKGAFEGLLGCEERSCISVEDRVLEELVVGSRFFWVNGLFEKWLKDVLTTCLVKKVNIGWGNGIRVSLCYGDRNMEGGGYMDSCLPKNVQVSFVD